MVVKYGDRDGSGKENRDDRDGEMTKMTVTVAAKMTEMVIIKMTEMMMAKR